MKISKLKVSLLVLCILISSSAIVFYIRSNAPSRDLTAYSWKFQSTLREESLEVPTNPDQFILTFHKGNVGTTTDCNSGSGEYVASKFEMKISDFSQTEMYCENSYEQTYLMDLIQVFAYEMTEDTLILTSKDATMMFSKIENPQ